jgi:hypothetical protein
MKEIKSENCGPGCDCGKPSGNKKIKVAVCLIVLLAVGGVFAYKVTGTKQSAPANTETAFAAPVANGVSQQKPDTAAIGKQETVAIVVEDKEAVQPIDEQKPAVEDNKKVGEYLDSLATLNKVALNQDAVFIFVPAKGLNFASKETIDAIASAQKKIESTGAKLGLYTLQSSSPEYANIASQLPPPSMLVMSKGRGMGGVAGGITEDKILQAYVASSRAGGCGPSGCGPSSAGCGPAPAPGPRVQ